MLRASHIGIAPIPPEKWAKMLRDAGAPEPWRDPNAAEKFSAAIASRVLDPVRRRRNSRDKARDAVTVLRRVLPEIIGEDEYWLNEYARRGYGTDPDQRAELGVYRRLQQALPEPCVFAKRRAPGKSWHSDAVRLFRHYQGLVDPDSRISADGPVAKFIKSALEEMGHRHNVTHFGIAKAIQRKL
jgi:hypothetical protein